MTDEDWAYSLRQLQGGTVEDGNIGGCFVKVCLIKSFINSYTDNDPDNTTCI